MVDLRAKPYYLNDEDIAWVENTIASMSSEEKVGQLFWQLTAGNSEEYLKELMEKYHLGVASPILCQGDLMGCVMLLLGEHDEPLQEADQKLAQIAANFLGSQMEN